MEQRLTLLEQSDGAGVDGTIFVIAVLSGQSKEDPVQIKD